MKTYTNYKLFYKLLAVAVLTFSMVSCGTSRETAYDDNDGIYSNTSNNEISDTEDVDKNYYKQYFQTKSQAYADIPEENVIFTDIDAYTSTDAYIDEEGVIHEDYSDSSESYGAWGENSEVSINIYSNPGWDYYGYWHRPFWWYGSGWGISYWGYGGFYRPFWGYGHPYFWSPWGSGYYAYNPYYNPYYGGYTNYVAYNRGRRNTDLNRSTRSVNRGTNASTRSNRSYTRSEANRRINNSSRSENVRRYSNQRSRGNTTRTAPRQRSQNARGTNNSRNFPSTKTTRSRTNTRSSGTINRGGTSVRSSGGTTTRSGGGSGIRGRGGRG